MRAPVARRGNGLFGATGTPDEDADAAVLRESALAPQGALLLATCDEDDGATARARSTRASPARSSWACSSSDSP